MNKQSIIELYNEGHSIEWIISTEYLGQYTKNKLTKKDTSEFVYETIYGYLKRKQDEI